MNREIFLCLFIGQKQKETSVTINYESLRASFWSQRTFSDLLLPAIDLPLMDSLRVVAKADEIPSDGRRYILRSSGHETCGESSRKAHYLFPATTSNWNDLSSHKKLAFPHRRV